MKVRQIGGGGERLGDFTEVSADDKGSLEKYSFTERVIDQLSKIGINEPPRPLFTQDLSRIYKGVDTGQYFDGRMPTTVKKLSLDELSDIYVLFDAWYEYLMYQFSLWKTKKSEYTSKTKLRDAQARKEAQEKGLNDQEQRTYARMDLTFVDLDAELKYCSAMFDYVECQVKTTSKNMSLISREITIREMKLNVKGKFRGYNRAAQRYAQHAEELGVEVEDGYEGEAPEPEATPPARARGVRRVGRTDHRAKKRR